MCSVTCSHAINVNIIKHDDELNQKKVFETEILDLQIQTSCPTQLVSGIRQLAQRVWCCFIYLTLVFLFAPAPGGVDLSSGGTHRCTRQC